MRRHRIYRVVGRGGGLQIEVAGARPECRDAIAQHRVGIDEDQQSQARARERPGGPCKHKQRGQFRGSTDPQGDHRGLPHETRVARQSARNGHVGDETIDRREPLIDIGRRKDLKPHPARAGDGAQHALAQFGADWSTA
jgi:hypothetical protein